MSLTIPKPKDVFDNPTAYWNFLTSGDDSVFEGQHFDRKEAGRVHKGKADLESVKQHIIETVSAFANSNRDGGVLVLGISKTGEIMGLGHLSDQERINLAKDLNEKLRNQSAQAKFVTCKNSNNEEVEICLIFVPYVAHAICETIGKFPQAWARHGVHNKAMDTDYREQLRRDKKIVDFERQYCCPYHPEDLDQGVLKVFKEASLKNSRQEHNDEELLFNIGALVRDSTEGYGFTNAGLLFFGANPQRTLRWAYIRLLRFEVLLDEADRRRLPSRPEKSFNGPLSKQILDMRAFFRETLFFRVFSQRSKEGGFIDEPEYPFVAIDEAIINAIVHRDYAVALPIECEAYKDSFHVWNPGHIMQRSQDLPDSFSLQETRLEHMPRNPLLLEWLKLMGDVRALSEGTKTMLSEMSDAGLPAPTYFTDRGGTKLTLLNNIVEREAQENREVRPLEFTNLYRLSFSLDNGEKPDAEAMRFLFKDFMVTLRDTFAAKGWFIDKFSFGRLVAHIQGESIDLPANVSSVVRFYRAYVFQIHKFGGNYFISIDSKLEIKNVMSLQSLLQKSPSTEVVGKSAAVRWNNEWQRGKVISINTQNAWVYLFDYDKDVEVANNQIIPSIGNEAIQKLLLNEGVAFDLYRERKKHSYGLEPNAARLVAEKTQSTVIQVSEKVFPLYFNGMVVSIGVQPTPLLRHNDNNHLFQLNTLPEPLVEFNRRNESVDIREGITSYGSYDSTPKNIEIIPICTPDYVNGMKKLLERLKSGSYKYKGSERTFSTKFLTDEIITVSKPETTLARCEELFLEHPEWGGDDKLNRIFLVYTPEANYSSDDENSPYYQVKRYLLEVGVPCQMVDSPTLLNADWKDLNLALNITAKCNVAPWVLPNAIPDADFFVGLSYTQNYRRGEERRMGYANVFNEYGRWLFYSGNSDSFPYEERTKHYRELVINTLNRLTLTETPNIYFHYSAKFSREDCNAILKAARSIKPRGVYSFVSINFHHNIQLFDSRLESDGSLSRGSYVAISPRQIYLSTTGYNPYRKSLGVPKPLEVVITTYPPEGSAIETPDLRSLAVQIFSLTKLNWSSTDTISGEPITTKYASQIAYLTAAFLRQKPSFKLHPVLEKTPWFL